MGRGSGKGFTVEVYEENDPTQRGSYTRSMTGGLSWRFRHWIYRGSAYLDAYTEWSTTQRGTFIYDALDRLDEASVSGGGSGLYIRDYSYDAIGNLTYKTDTGGYNYTTSLGLSGCTAGTPATKPHAARSASAFGSFGYDCNGNMTSRTIGGTTRSLTYNADNLLHQIKQGSTVLATYTYDGDGTLVKKVAGGQTTVYVGPHYEKNLSTGEVTKYYSLDGQRVAMREGSTLTYLHSDHLGSASLATNSSGGMISEMRPVVCTGLIPMARRGGPTARCRQTADLQASARRRASACTITSRDATTRCWAASSRRTRPIADDGSPRARESASAQPVQLRRQ